MLSVDCFVLLAYFGVGRCKIASRMAFKIITKMILVDIDLIKATAIIYSNYFLIDEHYFQIMTILTLSYFLHLQNSLAIFKFQKHQDIFHLQIVTIAQTIKMNPAVSMVPQYYMNYPSF